MGFPCTFLEVYRLLIRLQQSINREGIRTVVPEIIRNFAVGEIKLAPPLVTTDRAEPLEIMHGRGIILLETSCIDANSRKQFLQKIGGVRPSRDQPGKLPRLKAKIAGNSRNLIEAAIREIVAGFTCEAAAFYPLHQGIYDCVEALIVRMRRAILFHGPFPLLEPMKTIP